MSDALEVLRNAAKRAQSRSQNRVSVSPSAVLHLFTRLDRAEGLLAKHRVPLTEPRPRPRIEL